MVRRTNPRGTALAPAYTGKHHPATPDDPAIFAPVRPATAKTQISDLDHDLDAILAENFNFLGKIGGEINGIWPWERKGR